MKHQMLPERVHCNYLINIGKMIMKKRNQYTQAALMSVAVLASANVVAETVSVPATVTVDNTIDLAFTGTLDFGTLLANYDNSGDCSGLVLDADPATTSLSSTLAGTTATACANSGDSSMQFISGTLARPTITVSGVARYATLDVVFPTEVNLSSGIPNTPSLVLRDFEGYVTAGNNIGNAVTTTVQVDGTGAASFTIGATIATDDTTAIANDYQSNVAYVGNFDIEVTY